ncbi:DUF596 domain-containing protein [Xylella taiwanensis]|nr:DUF596 domain-containing protein [Xylella taiwanensis]AXI83688.1 hypothetical protein AB672_06955 [Xylella taiwanensis]MCD8456777.1 DUF596 domain-containing protein [Xylella taiwanensis]MCD8459187.1 DUF596 domain-containing protein [Xylella taiwanensis]MCD8461921.1 DUF596 domain-containing protein [Xylella taiwanensis]MCD8464275.1 DUF596 domain-containing protein [Xylella taiwanensis]
MLTQEQIDFIYEDLIHPLHFLWFDIGDAHGIGPQQIDPDSFEERKNDFFFLVGKLLDEGKLKLGHRKDERILEGSTEDLVERFRQCFPASDAALERGTWLVMEECPFVAVWLFEGEEGGEDYYGWCF